LILKNKSEAICGKQGAFDIKNINTSEALCGTMCILHRNLRLRNKIETICGI
jgi:hypothetical protein